MKSAASFRARVFPNPGFYGWVIVGVGFLCSMLSSPGQSFALSLYLESLITELGLSRLELSSLFATATLLAATCLPVVGGWADRTTGRRYLSSVLALLGVVLLLFSRVESAFALGAAFFALRLLGQGAIGLGTTTVTVRWFRRYRGRALAMVSLGYAFGEVVFPGTILTLIDRLGWRGSLVAFAALYLLVFTPLIAWLSRERADEDGPLDGWSEDAASAAARGADADGVDETSYTLGQALRTPVFWWMLVCVSVPPMVVTAVIFHQVALFEAQGWGASLVPTSFMVFAIGGVVMTYVMGLVMERVPSRFGVSASLVLMALSFGVAGLAPLFAPVVGAVLYGGILGIANGAAKAANTMVWPSYFGIEALGAVKGVVNAGRNGATAIGPPLAAILIGESGSFAPALLVFAALSIASAVAAGFLREPERESAVEPVQGSVVQAEPETVVEGDDGWMMPDPRRPPTPDDEDETGGGDADGPVRRRA